ncbi:MAG: tetratricopeptide repeat protein [Cyclobacteriaceae bacterium]
MQDKELRKKYFEICNNLSAKRIKPAFDHLGKLISENGLGIYYDEYRNLEETYHIMLQYTLEGIRDPERQKVYRKLIISVFELADKVNEAIRIKLSPSPEYEKKRAFRNSFITDLSSYLVSLEDDGVTDANLFYKDDENSRKQANEYHNKIKRLFYHVWFSDNIAPEDTELLSNFLLNSPVIVQYRSFIITSVMLSLQRFFDLEKFTILFNAFGSDESAINQRALVGLVINLYKYDDRMPFSPEIPARLKILNETKEFKLNLERIIIQFIRSKETEKLQQRIRDEFIPEMIKISPNLKNKINLDSLMEEGLTEDKNPDWEEIFKDSPGLLNKMEEFSEMQMKGADVFLGSFAMLKSFPFFNEIENWFIPFFPENPEVAKTLNVNDQTNQQLIEVIGRAPILCNSDKYSFCFSIEKLPKENREFMTQAMKAEMEQVTELKDDEKLLDPGRQSEYISNQYIQDLYRFYKLFPRKSDFEDIFNWRFDVHNKIVLGNIIKDDNKMLRNIAEYYFATNHLKEAAEIYEYLLEQKKNGELYQKIAWCHQKRGDFEKALDNYLKAELYEVNHLWNLKKIALCYRNLKQPDKALKYYREAEKIDPDDLSNQLNIGQSYLELDEFNEALKCYFKVEYLAPGNKKVWRPIAWCSFLTGKKDQAEKYFIKLLDDEPNKHDLINMGHVQWSLGNRKPALDFYLKTISTEKRSRSESPEKSFTMAEFLEVFEEDLPHLLNQGIDNDDVPIMLDQLRYSLEE